MKEQASSQAHVWLRAVQGHRLARNPDGWPEAKVMPVTAEQTAPGPKGEPGRMRPRVLILALMEAIASLSLLVK